MKTQDHLRQQRTVTIESRRCAAPAAEESPQKTWRLNVMWEPPRICTKNETTLIMVAHSFDKA